VIDRNRLFKELLTVFFKEFLDLFFPEVIAYLERDSLEFLDKEIFTDVSAGEQYKKLEMPSNLSGWSDFQSAVEAELGQPLGLLWQKRMSSGAESKTAHFRNSSTKESTSCTRASSQTRKAF